MALDAILLDVDGTLVDSNPAHVEAWRKSFADRGFVVAPDRIFVEVGKGGDNLVPAILGEKLDREHGKALRKAEPEEFAKLAERDGLRPFPMAKELIEEVRRRGLKAVLASSSSKQTLKLIEKASGLALTKIVDEVVGADDAERSKPAPDLVSAAVKKLGLSPAQCAMVGDTPYDAQSCLHAGVVCIGVRSGGHDDATLVGGGARLVYADTADLLAHFDDALKAASPGTAHLTNDRMESLMREALRAAREGLAAGEVPIGAVLARGDGTIIATGFNSQNASQDKSAHAEIVTFGHAAGKAPLDARDLILVSTLEPCVMCTGAAMIAGVDTIVYGLPAPTDGGTARVTPPRSPESQMPRIVGRILAKEARALLEHWLAQGNQHPQQAAYVKQLLANQPK